MLNLYFFLFSTSLSMIDNKRPAAHDSITTNTIATDELELSILDITITTNTISNISIINKTISLVDIC